MLRAPRSSWIYTILSYDIITKSSALWMTVASQIAIICQIAFLGSRTTAGIYYSHADQVAWISNGVLCAMSIAYTLNQPDPEKPEIQKGIVSSVIGKYYNDAVQAVFGSNEWRDFREHVRALKPNYAGLNNGYGAAAASPDGFQQL